MSTKTEKSYNAYYYSDLIGEARDWSFKGSSSFEGLQIFARCEGRTIKQDRELGDSYYDQIILRDEIVSKYLQLELTTNNKGEQPC